MKTRIVLAGAPIQLEWRYGQFLSRVSSYAASSEPLTCVRIREEDLLAARGFYSDTTSEAYIEFYEMCASSSDALLPFDRVIFHAAAFVWRGKAWLLTAPSGTGKSTQYFLWKKLYGEEVQIINGDKPVLEFREKEVWVHPSPWQGKENLGQMISAPLGGLIYLEQESENTIRPMGKGEAAGRIFAQFLFNRETVDDVQKVCALEERLLEQAPVWLLSNRGDEASAKLCHDTLMEELQR